MAAPNQFHPTTIEDLSIEFNRYWNIYYEKRSKLCREAAGSMMSSIIKAINAKIEREIGVRSLDLDKPITDEVLSASGISLTGDYFVKDNGLVDANTTDLEIVEFPTDILALYGGVNFTQLRVGVPGTESYEVIYDLFIETHEIVRPDSMGTSMAYFPLDTTSITCIE